MAIEIERKPWRRGDTPQHLGGQNGWHQAAAATSGQFWQMQSTGLWAPHTLVAADIPALDNTNLVDRARSFEITNFTIAVATPDLAVRGANLRYAAWAFDAAAIEAVTTQTFQIPRDYSTGVITIVLHWTNLGAGSGDVVWRVILLERNDAADLNATGGETSTDNTITAPAQDIQKISNHTISFTPSAAGVHVRMTVARIANAAGDTLANDAGLLKVQVVYTADS